MSVVRTRKRKSTPKLTPEEAKRIFKERLVLGAKLIVQSGTVTPRDVCDVFHEDYPEIPMTPDEVESEFKRQLAGARS